MNTNKNRVIFTGINFLVFTCLLLAGCSKDKGQYNTQFAKVSVCFNDFSVTHDEFPSKDGVDPMTYGGVGAMTLAFYDVEGTEIYKTTQIKSVPSTFTTFDTFTANLPVGTYTMVALGYAYNDGDVFTLTSPTEAAFTSERPREMFCGTQSVTVTNTNPLDLNVTLNRIVSGLTIQSTDNRPAGIAKIRTTYAKGGKSFNPTTGLALTDNGFTQTNNPSTAIGSTIMVTSFPFLYSDEESMDITIEVLDNGDNVLFTHTVSNVSFKRNRMTILQGNVFTTDPSGASFLLETSWLSDNIVPF